MPCFINSCLSLTPIFFLLFSHLLTILVAYHNSPILPKSSFKTPYTTIVFFHILLSIVFSSICDLTYAKTFSIVWGILIGPFIHNVFCWTASVQLRGNLF